MSEQPSSLLIGPFTQLLPLSQLPQRGAVDDHRLKVISNGGVLVNIHTGSIIDVGEFQSLTAQYPKAPIEEIIGAQVLIPGFIDCHTHICWGGTRARDYAMRIAGHSYLVIARAGGGIWDSVLQTRAASEERLTELVIERADRLSRQGITTVEVKSGYGLSVEHELKQLRAIRRADQALKIDLIPTCLAAHMKPKDFQGDEAEYLELLLSELLPTVKREQLSGRVDIFVEETAFDVSLARTYLQRAQAMGFEVTVHADQFSSGGGRLGVEVGALSVEHLEASEAADILSIAQADIVAVALPGASLGLGVGYAPCRALLDAGACVAISTDWNPGSAPMGHLLVQAATLSAAQKLSTAEVLAGLTFRAAKALGLTDRGRLQSHFKADLQSYPTDDYRDILYHQGMLNPSQVWKSGRRL